MSGAGSTSTQQERRADLVLHCAWLHGTAMRLFDEETDEDQGKLGQLAAQLLDFADLLGVADREGWWDR